MDLRCPGRLHGILHDAEAFVEVKCRSSRCGAERGVVVLHRFSVLSGRLIKTERFREPPINRKG